MNIYIKENTFKAAPAVRLSLTDPGIKMLIINVFKHAADVNMTPAAVTVLLLVP